MQGDEDLNDTRFSLLAWQVTGDQKGIAEIDSLPDGYITSCLSLYYFVKVSGFKYV